MSLHGPLFSANCIASIATWRATPPRFVLDYSSGGQQCASAVHCLVSFCPSKSHCLRRLLHPPMSASAPPSLALLSDAMNLSAIWPLKPYELLVERVARGVHQSYILSDDSLEKGAAPRTALFISVKGEGRKKDLDLGTFPVLYESSLDIIIKKWTWYSRLFEHLEPTIVNTHDLLARKRDLLDHWLREILYLGRVLEMAVQWSNSTPRLEPCIPLCYFLFQESTSSNHSLENTEEVVVPPRAPVLLAKCE